MSDEPIRILIVEARFYDDLADALLEGATQALTAFGAEYDVVTVPGALEIPAAISFALVGGEEGGTAYDGFVALGCVIRGETAHFDFVCGSATDGLLRVQLDHGLPVGFGLVTCDTVAQAQARAELGADGHNVGADAARAALEIAGLARSIRSS